MLTRPSEQYKGENYFHKNGFLYVNRAEENFHLPLHNHDFIELAYVAEGKGFHHIGERVVPVYKGMLFLLPPGMSHVFRPSTPSRTSPPLIVYNCIFLPSLLLQLSGWIGDTRISDHLEQRLTDPIAPESLFDSDNVIDGLFRNLLREYELPRSGSAAYLQSLLVQLLLSIYRIMKDSQEAIIEGSASVAFHHVLNFLDQHAHEPLSLAQLAERCSWSERHFSRVFKQHTGQTFLHYIQHLRIKKSCELLRSSQLKISHIAEESGYKNMDVFLTHFKRIAGMTPREYRRMVQEPSKPITSPLNNNTI